MLCKLWCLLVSRLFLTNCSWRLLICNASDVEVHRYVGCLLLWLYCVELFLLTICFLLQDACCA